MATKGLIPAKGRTGRYVAALVVVLTVAVAAFVALTVATFTAARGTPGFAVLLPIWLGVGALLGALVAFRLRHWWVFLAVMFVAAAGALTWGFLGDTHGDAAWIAVVTLMVGTLAVAVILIATIPRRGRALEQALDRCHFDGATLADLDASDLPDGAAPRVLRHRAAVRSAGLPLARDRHRVERRRRRARTDPALDRGAGLRRAPPRLPARRPGARRARCAAGPPVERVGRTPRAGAAPRPRRRRRLRQHGRRVGVRLPRARRGQRHAPARRRRQFPRGRQRGEGPRLADLPPGRAPGARAAGAQARPRHHLRREHQPAPPHVAPVVPRSRGGRRRPGRGDRARADVTARRVRRVHR